MPFGQIAAAAARACGRPAAFLTAVAGILVWAGLGPVFGYSEGWQLVVNTGTTIVTFLMVFLLQNAQARDTAAVQAKLDELIRASADARNEIIGLDLLTDEEIAAERAKGHPR